jgi:hypothetical protein
VAEILSPRIAVVRERLSRVAGWLAFGVAILPVAVYAVAAAHLSPFARSLLEKSVPAALALAALAYVAGQDWIGWAGSLRREGDVLVIRRGRSERRVPLSTIREGIIVPGRDRVTVELALANGETLAVRFTGMDRARALLHELEVDAAHQRCRVQLADRTAARVVALATPVSFTWLAVSGTGVVSRLSGDTSVAFVFGVYAMLVALLHALIATPDVTVGTDGLSFRRGLRERFVPYAQLEDLRVDGLGAVLHLRGGRRLRLPSIAGVSPARLEALQLRIQEAKALRDAAPAHDLVQLDRAGRTIPEWRNALAALARRGSDYRASGLSPDDLSALLGSPDTPAERRLAAALTLAAGHHPAAPERIRVAAAQCASERLRAALESVTTGNADEAAIEEALAEEEGARSAPAREGRRG